MLSQKLKIKLLKVCYSIYPKKITALLVKRDTDFPTFLKKNRLEKTNKYDRYKKNLIKSLKLLKKILGKEPFTVIKTISSYPHITSDLDVVVKNKILLEKLKKINFPIKTDINNRVSWTNGEEISRDFIWNNIQNYDFHGVKVLVPNTNLDVLIRMAHLPFEQAEIRLGELLHLFKQFKNINWRLLENEAKINGWPKTFKRVKKLLNQLHYSLFNSTKSINFPYRLSWLLLIQSVIEKKAWKKIWGARYIIKDRLLK